MTPHQRLKELTNLHEKIRLAILGADWETKLELRNLLTRVEDEMRAMV